jgi:EAL domain-containing protein (putative c-di-GMP-specific phosphodiesterase class I)/CheY-like chemotaxis protein
MNYLDVEARKTVQFGRRRAVPRACVIDRKPHIRTFLSDTFEELGFISRPCGRISDVTTALADFEPDLVVLGLLIPESDVTQTLRVLKAEGYRGRVMLFGGRASTALPALHGLGEELGLAMLPPLATPFRHSDLRENLSPFLPIPISPGLPVDVGEAMRNGWLELWYQPKINLREMMLSGAEAMVRMRHPTWGIVPPSFFIPNEDDPNLHALSSFVVDRALADWNLFAEGRAPIEMTIHLPSDVLEQHDFIERMCRKLPSHAAVARLTVEIDSLDLRRDHSLLRATAKQLAAHNVGLSIDDVMAEASWVDVVDFPIAELQVEAEFINGCADDHKKREACEIALNIARKLGARTLAKGIERTADCRAVCKMGFDVGQGFLFAKPMEMHRFARTMLRRPSAAPG